MTLTDALRVLSAAQHRGARWWCYDARCMRVMPGGWRSQDGEPAPAFTVFETLMIARGLTQIGAVQAADAPGWHVAALP